MSPRVRVHAPSCQLKLGVLTLPREDNKLSEAAENDLRELYRYGVLTFGPAVADKYYDGLISRFEEIAEHPRLYQAIDAIRHGYRRSVYGVHSLYYRITPEGVTIIRILRGQNPEDALPD